MSYLRSDENEGTDESEVSLNLPLKSPYRSARDTTLRQLQDQITSAETARRDLFFSGLLREVLWSARIAATRVHYSQLKIDQISALQARQQRLFEARSASRYSMLLLRHELAEARLMMAEQERELARWRDHYRQLTGATTLPHDITEAAPLADETWQSHPALRILELNWARQQAVLAADSTRGEAWNLSLQAKRLDNPLFEENQYGLALEVPLSGFSVATQSTRSEWQEASRSYWQQRDELQLQLSRSWQALQVEASYLAERQMLLQESTGASRELLAETELLLGQNELAREIWIRRVLQDLDTQADAAINELLIGQNRAMSRQAAGIPL